MHFSKVLVFLAAANKIKAGQADDLPCCAPEYIIGDYCDWLKTDSSITGRYGKRSYMSLENRRPISPDVVCVKKVSS